MTPQTNPTLTDPGTAAADRSRVLVLDRRGTLAAGLARAAERLEPSPEVLRLRRPDAVLEAVEEARPDVLVAAPEELTKTGLRRLARVHRAHPRLVILLSPNGKPVAVREAAACGAADVLPFPSTAARMRVKLRQALEWAEELNGSPAPAPAQPAPAPVRTARVFTITSATGGCGKTFFATNLAAYLARATGGRVLLVDLDLQFGEVGVSLRLRPERTIAELVEEDDPAASLDDYTVEHRSGFRVLCAPKDPVAAERVGPREAGAILEAAASRYDYVVVDTPPAMNEVVLAAFDRSQSLVVMATMDVPSLRNLRVFLQTLDRLQLPTDDVSLVLNKEEPGTGIDPRRIEQAYPKPFSAVLPYAREVTRSINAGLPVIDAEPASDISRRLLEGARVLQPPTTEGAFAQPAPRPGWLSRLFRKGASR